MVKIIKLLLSFILLFSFYSQAKDACSEIKPQPTDPGFITSVKEGRATLWSQGGYHWKHCDTSSDLTKTKNSMQRNELINLASSCTNARLDFPTEGTPMMIHTDAKGNPLKWEFTSRRKGEAASINYYCVSYYDDDKKLMHGWVNTESVSAPSMDSKNKIKLNQCGLANSSSNELAKATDTVQRTNEKSTLSIVSAAQKKPEPKEPEGRYKNESELENFMCIHRKDEAYNRAKKTREQIRAIEEKAHQKFKEKYARFKLHSQNAEKAFGIPFQITLCTALIESGFRFIPNEAGPDDGYFQFTAPTVVDMKKRLNKNYKSEWANYTKRNASDFNDINIRTKEDSEMAVAAGSLYLKWLIEKQVASSCSDCHRGPPPDEKTIFLAIAGYNWSPFEMPAIARRSKKDLLTSYPPPPHTRVYMEKMRKCLSPESMLSFDDKPAMDIRCNKCLKEACASAKVKENQ